MGNPQRYSKEFQERAVRRMKLGDNVSQLARELGVDRTCLYAWKRKLGSALRARAWAEAGLAGPQDRGTGGQRSHVWKGSSAGSARSWIFSRVPCEGSTRRRDERRWRECIYAEIRERMRAQGELSIQRMCELAGVSRASFYRNWERREPAAAETELRGRSAAAGAGASILRLSANCSAVAAGRICCGSQESAAPDARRQPAGHPPAESSWSPPTPTTASRCGPTWRSIWN